MKEHVDITGHKGMVEELRVFDAILSNMTEGIVLTRAKDRIIVYTNQNFTHMFGFGEGELVGKSVVILNAPGGEDPEEVAKRIIASLESTGVWRGIVHNAKKDGTTFWCSANVTTFEHHLYGKVWLAVHQDITERKKAEEALRKAYDELEQKVAERTGDLMHINEALECEIAGHRHAEKLLRDSKESLRDIIESTADGILAVSPSGKIIMTNRRFADLWRIPQPLIDAGDDNLLLKFVLDQLVDPDGFLRKVNELYGTAQQSNDELLFKDGRIFERYSAPMVRESSIVGRVWSFRDVTEYRRAQDAVRRSEEKYRELVETANSIILGWDTAGKITFLNDYAGNFFGFSKAELLGRNVVGTIVPLTDSSGRDLARLMEAIQRDPDHFRDNENENITKDGRRVLVRWANKAIVDQNNTLIGILSIGNDITDRKKTEEELIKYRDQLEELVDRRTEELTVINAQLRQAQKLEAIGLLAGGIAHDFNNILTTIKGAVYILNRKIDQDSPLAKYPEQILSSIKKGTDLAQSLLAFSRKQTITLMHLDLNELINDSFTLLRRLLGEHIEIVLALHRNLPFIMGDRNQMQQVLINLAANARDAMPKGGSLTIRTGLIEIDETFKMEKGFGTLGEHVLLEVSDTGTGIEKNIEGKIFEPFFTTKGLGEGSGLGLSVTYGIVKQHNGFIDFDSISHKGTTFRIYFPYAKSVHYCSGKQEAVSADEDENREKETKTILLAEDDNAVRSITGDVLGMEGYTVIEAKEGVEAVRLFTENLMNIDLAILDVRMPGKNGREVYEEIKRLRPETPVLFVSGYTADIIESDGILREGLNFIPKTATPEELLEKIRQIIYS